jgi:imidazolonepropionase-like amidohydrolase
LAKKHKLKTAFGSDMLFSETLAARQGTMLTHLTRWYWNAEILTMATATNAELLGLSGPRNPYPGKLGVVEEARLLIRCWSTAIPSRTSGLLRIRRKIFSSS